jgi:flagellar protein FlaG
MKIGDAASLSVSGVTVIEDSAPPVASKAPAVKVAEPAMPAREDVEAAVERANRHIAVVAPSLEFEIDANTQQLVIRLVDRADRSVLRQVPSPEMLAIAKALDRMQAMLVRVRA